MVSTPIQYNLISLSLPLDMANVELGANDLLAWASRDSPRS